MPARPQQDGIVVLPGSEGHAEVARVHLRRRVDAVRRQVTDHLVAEEVERDPVVIAPRQSAAEAVDVEGDRRVEVPAWDRQVEDVIRIAQGPPPRSACPLVQHEGVVAQPQAQGLQGHEIV